MIQAKDSILRIMVTGHRDMGTHILTFKAWVTQILNDAKAEYTKIKAVSGMALGADQIFAEVASRLGIPLVAAIPFSGQDGWRAVPNPNIPGHNIWQRIHQRAWPASLRDQYRKMLKDAEARIYVENQPGYSVKGVKPGVYHPTKFQMRNKWMVDWTAAGDASLCIAFYRQYSMGGTANCIELVKEANIPILYFPFNIVSALYPAGQIASILHPQDTLDNDVLF